KIADVRLGLRGRLFVGLGEDQRKRRRRGFEPAEKLEIDRLRRVTRIDEDKNAAQIGAAREKLGDGFVELEPTLLANLGVPVTGQINEAPGAVDDEEIDEL